MTERHADVPQPSSAGFPGTRMRRLRRTPALRELVRETRVEASDLVYPMFVDDASATRTPVPSMPGVDRLSVEAAADEAAGAWADGIRAVLLFGIPRTKDARGSRADRPDGVIQRALPALREAAPDMVLITDVCLCEYTDHGHCGIIEDGDVANDASLERLVAQAVSHAEHGADIVAPSDMMDGRVGAIRVGLDAAGCSNTAILSYAAKYASAFYGPFRDAADSAPAFGDRRSYQMDPRNADEALREVALDIAEGADMVMVKPALPSLDVVRRVKDAFGLPTAAYQVSGEYAMLEAAADRGWLDGEAAHMETLLAIRRAGADLVVTYAARRLARALAAG
ncbi:MAG: porphobilinogen synthase [Gemmatimonadota bacterium]